MPETEPERQPARILIVDDHPNTASMLARTLGQFKTPIEVLTAVSGEEALEIINQKRVDVLATDFMMPGMNGLELIERLQGVLAPAHTILITAYDSPGLAATARRLRVNDYLVKPIQPQKIRDVVASVLDGLAPLAAPPPPPGSPPKQFKLLIADDQVEHLFLLTTRLQPDYQVITAGDGEEAITKIRAERPDLVLLDVNMPNKSGFDVLIDMHADPELAGIPVIVMTAARIEPHDIRQGLSLGADDYITKPYDWRELASRIRAKLRVKQMEDSIRRRNIQLGLLPEIGQDLSARVDAEELALVTLRRSVDALGATNAHLAIFQPDNTIFHKIYDEHDFFPLKWHEVQERSTSEGIVAHVVASKQGIIVNNTRTDTRYPTTPNDPSHSALSVPLLSRRGVIGVLTLLHDQPSYFNNDHLTLLQAISSQAAIAIENAQLYGVEHRRVQELVALNQLAREIGVFTHSAELFEKTPALIRDALGYPGVSLWTVESGQPVLRSFAGSDKSIRPSMLALAPEQVAVTGQPSQLSGAVEERSPERQGSGSPPTHSVIAVPMFWEAKVSGVLAIHSVRPNAFQESDRVVLENLAAQAAGALQRIRLFESVEQEQKRLAAVLYGAADAIMLLDEDARLLLVNPAAQRLFTDVETKLGQVLPRGQGYDALVELLDKAHHSGENIRGEIRWPDKRSFAVMITPFEEGGQVVVMHDVTHFKELDRVKNEFIATASHDLKGPITAIFGYSHLLEKAGPLNPQQDEYINRMQKAGKQMHELVQNLMELVRIDLGVDLKPEPADVRDLLASSIDEFYAQATTKQQSLTLLPLEGRPTINADIVRLRQALRNLVGNAVKYTPEGGSITVGAKVVRDSFVRVEVTDSGFGIPADDLPHIFDKFYRVHTEVTRDIEGNGLGLAIVKAIIDQHDGSVSVESEVGKGSCFTFTLPLATRPAQ